MSIYAPKTSKNHPTSKQMHKNHHVRFWGSSIPDFSDPPSGTVSREHLLTFLQWFNSLEPATTTWWAEDGEVGLQRFYQSPR